MYMKWDIYIFPNFNLPSSLLLFFRLYIGAFVPKSQMSQIEYHKSLA